MKLLSMKGLLPLVIMIMMVRFAAPSDAAWFVEPAQSPHSFSLMGPRSQIVDTYGYPHIAYGEDHLYHAWWDGQIWQTEIVDPSPQTGQYTAFRMAGLNNLHIAYYDALFGSIKYAYRYRGLWSIQTVVTGSDIATPFALAIDSDYLPWIAFVDETSGQLLVTHRISGTEWAVESLATVTDKLNGIAMEFHQGMPRIAFSHGPSNASGLHFLYFDGTQWQSHPLDISGDVGYYLDMAVSDQDDVHLSYMDYSTTALKHVVFTPGGWPGAPEVVDASGFCGYYSSIRLTATGLPLIAYLDLTAGHRIRYAVFNGASWNIHALNVLGKPGLYLSVSLLETGAPRFSYYDTSDYALQFTQPSSSGWNTDKVDIEGLYGVGHALLLDSAGDPTIPMNNGSGGGVHVCRFDGTGWTTSVISDNPLAGGQISAAVDQNHDIGICFSVLDAGGVNGTLRFARETESGWTFSMIDDSDLAQMTSALAFDSLNRPHAVYFDANQSLVKYAVQTPSGWQIETVASDQGTSVTTAIDGTDRLHISYHSQNDGLKYGYRSPTGWNIQTLTPPGSTERHPKLALDRSRQPHIVSYDQASSEIRYRRWNGTGWELSVVDFVDLSTAGLAFRLGTTDRPCVLFHDDAELALRYATTDDNGQWRTVTVHPGPMKTSSCAIAFDRLDRASVSFYDVLTGDLYVGRQRPEIYYDLSISDAMFQPGENFVLTRSIHNSLASMIHVVEYVILDVYGSYWFAPGWTPTPDSELRHIAPSWTATDTMFAFTWPADVGTAAGIRFWGGLVMFDAMEFIDYDLAEFGWN